MLKNYTKNFFHGYFHKLGIFGGLTSSMVGTCYKTGETVCPKNTKKYGVVNKKGMHCLQI